VGGEEGRGVVDRTSGKAPGSRVGLQLTQAKSTSAMAECFVEFVGEGEIRPEFAGSKDGANDR
jgi:hypothetical protein